MQLFVGTSAFSEPKWKGKFYPPKLPQKEMLPYYAQHFAAVEINSTFYKMPVASDLAAWTAQVPRNFRFALKSPQTITHRKRLKDTAEPTKQLFEVAASLKNHLGPILFGLPPNFKIDLPRLEAFLKLVPREAKVAFEFRHASWFDDEVFDCLRKHRAALCIAHTDDFPKPEFIATTTWGYVRLRREKYSKKDLAKWVAQIQSQSWNEAHVYFKHEDTGTGPKFAAQFLKLAVADK
jgi:uncharacterized protein YecE (DUF72 family)